jgi:ubiquinone/menaquinone biosynthesis C-methylase UbiE
VIAKLVAAQLRRPSGRVGRVLGNLLNRSNRDMNRRAVAHLDVRSGQRLLDIGFGGGVGIDAMLDISDTVSVVGVDFSDDMVDQQRARFAGNDRVRIEHADVAQMPFADAHFDRALSSNTIYFWPDPAASLLEIRRVLRPGGRLVLACATPRELERFPPARHGFTAYGCDDLRRLLQDTGYDGLEFARPRGERAFFTIAHRSAD